MTYIYNQGDYLPPIPHSNPQPTPPSSPSFPPITPSSLSLNDQVSAIDTLTGLLTTLATVDETYYGGYSYFGSPGQKSKQSSANATILSDLAKIKEGINNQTMTLMNAQCSLNSIGQSLAAPQLDLSSNSSVTGAIQKLVSQIAQVAVTHSSSDANGLIQTAASNYSDGDLTPNQVLQQIGDSLNDYRDSFHKVPIPFSAPEIPNQWNAPLSIPSPPP